jgi:hypothetical protein
MQLIKGLEENDDWKHDNAERAIRKIAGGIGTTIFIKESNHDYTPTNSKCDVH